MIETTKLTLGCLLIAIVGRVAFELVQIASGQTVGIYTEKGVLTNKPDMADYFARAAERDEARKPWTEPTPLPGNRDRDLPLIPVEKSKTTPTPTPKPKPTAQEKTRVLKGEAVTPWKP